MLAALHGSLEVWAQLLEALHGVAGYGSDVAEIYAYHLMPYSPMAHGGFAGSPALLRDLELLAARDFLALAQHFEARYEVAVLVEIGRDEWRRIGAWFAQEPFGHRAHIKIDRLDFGLPVFEPVHVEVVS